MEDEVRRVVEATVHRSLHVQRAAARTGCVLLLLVFVLLLCVYLYMCPNTATNIEVGRVEARLRELDMSYYICVLLLY